MGGFQSVLLKILEILEILVMDASSTTTQPNAMARSQAQSFTMVALFAALMAVLGLIPKIDLPLGVPLTVQSVGVMLAGCLLGGKRALQALLLFLLAVAVGLPLLSGGRGGLAQFMLPSSGYLWGYAVAAGATGWFMALLLGRKPQAASPRRAGWCALLASVLGGVLVLHTCGILGLMWIAKMQPLQALMVDMAFIPGDLLKSLLCAAVVHHVAKALPDWPLGGRQTP